MKVLFVAIYASYYTTIYALNYDGGVYLSEGMWIYPDGKIEHTID